MAWNPSPQVAVARDAAVKLSEILNRPVHKIVVLFVTDDELGYASYGRTSRECNEAKVIGDKMYGVAMQHFESQA